MTSFALAVSTFVGLHWVLSSHPVRTPLIARLGPAGFSAAYSVLVGAAFAWILLAYGPAGYVPLWAPPTWTAWVPLVVMPLAAYLWVAGFTTKSPTATGQGGALADPEAAKGILRVTRHPALFGFTIFGLAHLAANGDVRSVWLFGGIVALAVVGMLHIDHRRRRAHGDAWDAFARRTSVVPFAAILAGRQRLVLRELGVVRPLAAIGVVGALLLVHEWVIGVSPVP